MWHTSNFPAFSSIEEGLRDLIGCSFCLSYCVSGCSVGYCGMCYCTFGLCFLPICFGMEGERNRACSINRLQYTFVRIGPIAWLKCDKILFSSKTLTQPEINPMCDMVNLWLCYIYAASTVQGCESILKITPSSFGFGPKTPGEFGRFCFQPKTTKLKSNNSRLVVLSGYRRNQLKCQHFE